MKKYISAEYAALGIALFAAVSGMSGCAKQKEADNKNVYEQTPTEQTEASVRQTDEQTSAEQTEASVKQTDEQMPMKQTETDIKQTYEQTPMEQIEAYMEDGKEVTRVPYYEMSDGTWKTDDYAYKYRLVITGRLNNAEKDSTYIILSNRKDITFDQAWKASGLSSNTNDYFDVEDAVIVAVKL